MSMDHKKLRTAIVGCGKVGAIHARALQSLPGSEFVAACGRDRLRTEQFAAAHRVLPFTDVVTMIDQARIDLAIICTPHPLHADAAIAAIQGGAHVLVEKPLAATLSDCDAMIEASRRYGRVLGTVCQRRFFAPCQRIRQAIDNGRIGRPILGTVAMFGWRDAAYYDSDAWRGTWLGEGGGVLVNQAPHQLDLLLWYLGEIDELYGYPVNLNHPTIEVEDSAVAVIRFKSGAIGNVVVSNSIHPALHGKVHIYGSNGAAIGVQTDGGAMFIAGVSSITEPPVNDLWTVPGEADRLQDWVAEDSAFFLQTEPIQYYHERQVEDFLNAVTEGRPPLVTAEDGRRTVELFTAIYRSQRERRPLVFPLAAEAKETEQRSVSRLI